MADTVTLEHSGANGSATVSTKPPIKATNLADAPTGEGAKNGLPEVSKATHDEGDDEVDDEYDFEEEQQAVEGEDDEYRVTAYHVEEEDDDDDDGEYDGEGEEGDHDHDHDHEHQPAEANGAAAPGAKPNLTALLLGDPNAADEDEDEGGEDDDEGEDDDGEYNGGEYNDDDDDDEGDDFMEESTPITPTSKKRGIEEAREDEEDEDEDEDEGVSKKKVRS